MTPDAVTVSQIADLQVINSLLVGLSIGLAFLFWWVDRLRQGGCPNCTHCQKMRREENEIEEAKPASPVNAIESVRTEQDSKRKPSFWLACRISFGSLTAVHSSSSKRKASPFFCSDNTQL